MVAWVLAPLLDLDDGGSLPGYAIYLLLVAAPLSAWVVRKTLARTREVRELEDELDELWRMEAGMDRRRLEGGGPPADEPA